MKPLRGMAPGCFGVSSMEVVSPTMGTKTIAVLVTFGFSIIGVVGDYFLKLASARERPLRTVLSWLFSVRLNGVRLGVRNESSKTGHHQRPLLCVPGATPDRRRRGAVPGIIKLL